MKVLTQYIAFHLAAELVDTVFIDRFRIKDDRKKAQELFESCFGVTIPRVSHEFVITSSFVKVGNVVVKRNCNRIVRSPNDGLEPLLIRTLQRAMETVGRCVNMNWPCLLVGSSSTGKSAILRTMSDACSIHLEEVALSPSSDVSELLGCFEQIDSLEIERELVFEIRELYYVSSALLVESNEELLLLQRISTLIYSIFPVSHTSIDCLRLSSLKSDDKIMLFLSQLVQTFSEASRISNDFFSVAILKIKRIKALFQQIVNKSSDLNKDKGCFRWVDGILVDSMLKGHWLHLENVNFCSSSVLDRLNPLMESGGELILTECGSFEGEVGAVSGSRIVKPHPNFRLFLSMNPVNGEVSRAMRNRCIETFLTGPGDDGIAIVNEKGFISKLTPSSIDAIDCLQRAGVGSVKVAKLMLETHCVEGKRSKEVGDDSISVFNLHQWGAMYVSLVERGLVIQEALLFSFKLVYGIDDDCPSNSSLLAAILRSKLMLDANVSQIRILRFESMLVFNPIYSQVMQDSRLLHFLDSQVNCPVIRGLPAALELIETPVKASSEFSLQLEAFCLELDCILQETPRIINILLSKYIKKWIEGGQKVEYIKYFDIKFSTKLADVGKLVAKNLHELTSSFKAMHNNDRKINIFQIFMERLHHITEETQTYYRALKGAGNEVFDIFDCGAIEVSFLLAKGIIDRSSIKCRVTPIFYYLFEALDKVLSIWIFSTDVEINTEVLKRVFNQRDCFWRFLQATPFLQQNIDSFIALDENGFFVHWRWLNKILYDLFGDFMLLNFSHKSLLPANLYDALRKFQVTLASLKEALLEATGVSGLQSDACWKRGGHPLVPFKCEHWEAKNELEVSLILIAFTCVIN